MAEALRHSHVFLGVDHERNARRTWAVVALSVVTMAVEIGGGLAFGSMGLIAEGLHMATHAGVLTVVALTYAYARRRAQDERFTFGTGRLGDLSAFASAVMLGVVALLLVVESVERLMSPVHTRFGEALPVAVLGLAVSVVSAWLLSNGHNHRHNHSHASDHPHADHGRGQDLNIRAAYLHLLSDVVVSLLAIVGLTAGRWLGWLWTDPLMGLIGAAVVAQFAFALARGSGAALVDLNPDPELCAEIRRRMAAAGAEVFDLHLWRVGPGHYAAIVGVTAGELRAASWYRERLQDLPHLSHLTVEVEPRRPAADDPARPRTRAPASL